MLRGGDAKHKHGSTNPAPAQVCTERCPPITANHGTKPAWGSLPLLEKPLQPQPCGCHGRGTPGPQSLRAGLEQQTLLPSPHTPKRPRAPQSPVQGLQGRWIHAEPVAPGLLTGAAGPASRAPSPGALGPQPRPGAAVPEGQAPARGILAHTELPGPNSVTVSTSERLLARADPEEVLGLIPLLLSPLCPPARASVHMVCVCCRAQPGRALQNTRGTFK